MCEALERRYKEQKITGVIESMRYDGKSDEDIIERVIKMYNVKKDYVLSIISLQPIK